MEEVPEAEPPVSVDLDRERTLTVVWSDEQRSVFDLTDLRRACPCATCRGLREQQRPVGPSDVVQAIDAELVGRWGMRITWSDGHDTGIYAWGMLRAWHDDTHEGGEA